jgi:hypothetical protein
MRSLACRVWVSLVAFLLQYTSAAAFTKSCSRLSQIISPAQGSILLEDRSLLFHQLLLISSPQQQLHVAEQQLYALLQGASAA